MTEKQKLFCDEYLKDLNGTRAYRAIYKNIKTDNAAGVRANKLLKKKDIAEYINKRLEEIHNGTLLIFKKSWNTNVSYAR